MTDDTLQARIAANLTALRQQLADAAARSGRPAEAVRLVAVTKYVGLAAIRALQAAGVREIGESRVQQLRPRIAALGADPQPMSAAPGSSCRWHFVGHLQRNKVKYLFPDVRVIHSLDSWRLAETISAGAAKAECVAECLLEVNIAGEDSKHGVSPVQTPALCGQIGRLPNLRLAGLMAMAPYSEDAEAARPHFARLRELRDRLHGSGDLAADRQELSMGMSGDFEVGIEEGATLVRIGSALFEGLSDEQRGRD